MSSKAHYETKWVICAPADEDELSFVPPRPSAKAKTKNRRKQTTGSYFSGTPLTASQKNVLTQMADDHLEDHGYCWPSIPDIALRTRLSDKQCRRVVQQLERMGLIESMPQVHDGSGARLANAYRFWFDPPFDQDKARAADQKLKMQALKTAARPVQMTLTPPPMDGRGSLPRVGGGHGHRREGPPDTDGRVPLPRVGGLKTSKRLPEDISKNTRSVEAAALWEEIKIALLETINRQSWNTWLKPTRGLHLNGRTLVVEIPSPQFDHIGERYGDLIQQALAKLKLDIKLVRFEVSGKPDA